MDKRQVRDQGKRRTMLNGALTLAVIAMMAGSVLGAGQTALGANLGLLAETTYKVWVETGPSAPLQGVLIEVTTASGGIQTSGLTDAAGSVAIAVPDTFAGVTTPYMTAYEFTPVNAIVNFPNPSVTDIVFTAAASSRLINVSGTISVQGGGVLAGATVTVAGDGVPTTQTLTDASGVYSIDLPVNATNVTLTPGLVGYTFTPPSAALRPLASAQTQNFTATPTTALVTISGDVTGVPAGTVVTLSASGSETTSTQITGSGPYALSVNSGFTGTVTPSAVGVTFLPANRTYTNITANQTAQDYAGSAAATLNISGTVTGVPAGTVVTLAVTAGTPVVSTQITGSSTYTLTVNSPFTGTITPSGAGLVFTPASRTYTNVTTDTAGQDYAVVVFKTISGQVRVPAGTAATTVTINVTGASSDTVLITTSGIASGATPFSYRVTVQTPFSGYVMASANGWIFLPSRRAYDQITSDRSGQDFDGQVVPISAVGLTDVYNIIYKKDGRGKQVPLDGASGIVISSGSIIITGSSAKDTLSIKIKPVVKKDPVKMANLPAIQLIQTSTGFASFLSEARISNLKAKEALTKVITTNASIGKIETDGNLGTIAMADNKRNAEVISSIFAKTSFRKLASVKLVGIKLEVLVAPKDQPFRLIQMETKKHKVAGTRPAEFYVAVSGFIGGAGATYDLQAGTVNSLLNKGAILGPNTIVGYIKNIKGTTLGLNNIVYPAHISIGYLHATQDISISAAGGDIEPGLYLVDGKVITFNSTVKKFRPMGDAGGFIGNRDNLTTTVAPTTDALTAVNTVVLCSGLKPVTNRSTARDISGIYGQTGVYGLFVAGGKATLNAAGDITAVTPQLDTAGGKVKLIKTSAAGAGVARIYGDVALTKRLPKSNANLKVYQNNSTTPMP